MITSNFSLPLLVLALVNIYPAKNAVAAPAGIAQFTAGEVSLRRPDGQSAPLAKGKDIESGEAIVTGATGRAQVKFSDGGMVSLQPNTEFRIANYVDKSDPQQDRFLVDFLRGSMRAITGLIGKRNKDNYRVTTTTATIGIRGSGFSAAYNPDGSLTVTAEKDAIEVCSGGVCTGLVAGESVTVRSGTEAPIRAVNRASIPTPGLAQDVVTIGNQTNADGSSRLITFVDRTFTDINVVGVATDPNALESYWSNPFLFASPSQTTTLFRNNKLLMFSFQGEGLSTGAETAPARPVESFQSIGNITDPDFVGWGMWTKGTLDFAGAQQFSNVHYVAGRPTADITTLFNACAYCSYNYALIGGSTPTQGGNAGSLYSTGTSFVVNTLPGGYFLEVTIATSFGSYQGITNPGATSTSFGNGYYQGSFFGNNAERAGLTYSFTPGTIVGPTTGLTGFQYGPTTGTNIVSSSGGGKVTGALVFQKPSAPAFNLN